MALSSTAVFRAVADFAAANREVSKLRREFERLQREANQTSFSKFDSALGKTANAQSDLRKETNLLNASRRKLAGTEDALVRSVKGSNQAFKGSTSTFRPYEKATSSANDALRRLHETQQKARTSTDSLSTSRRNSQDSLGKLSTQIANVQKAETSAIRSADSHRIALNREGQAATRKVDQLTTLSAHLVNLADTEEQAATSARSHADALRSESDALKRAASAHRANSSSTRDGARSADDASRSNDRLRDSTDDIAPSTRRSRSGVDQLAQSLRGFGLASVTSRRQMGSLRPAILALLIPAVGVGLQVLTGAVVALGAALVGIVGAIGPAAGALATIGPAALAAAGAVGTVALAFKGIGAALKAQTAAAKDTSQADTTAASRRADAARAVLNAQDALRNAVKAQARATVDANRQIADADRRLTKSHKDVADALKDLNLERQQAVRDLVDLRNATRDATLSEEASNIALLEAQQRQSEVNADAASTDLERRKAALDVAEAQASLEEAQLRTTRSTEDLNKSVKAGVDGSPNVINASDRVKDAKDREADAERDLADAKTDAAFAQEQASQSVIQAQRGLEAALENATEATNKQSAAQRNLATAMAALSPAGRDFVNYLLSLKPLMDQMSHAAQETLFPGFISALKILTPLVGTVAIPSIKAFGGVIAQFAIDAATHLKAFETDFKNFGTGGGPKLIEKFGGAFLNFADAILQVTFAAEPLLQWLADVLLKFSEWLGTTTKTARETGRLAKFFDQVRETLQLLGDILFNVGGIFRQVFKAAAPLGRRLLETFRDATKKASDYLHTAEGFGKTKKYFDDMEPSIRIVFKWIGMIAKAFLGIGASKTTFNLLKQIDEKLVPALQRLSDALGKAMSSIGPKFIDFLSSLADVISNLINAGGGGALDAFVTIFKAFADALKFLTEIPGVATLGSWLLAIAGGLAAIKAIGKITGLSKIAGGLNRVAGGAAAARAGETVSPSGPTTFSRGLATGVTGGTKTPKTATARAGRAIGVAIGGGRGSAPGVLGASRKQPPASPGVSGAASPLPQWKEPPVAPGVLYPPGSSRSTGRPSLPPPAPKPQKRAPWAPAPGASTQPTAPYYPPGAPRSPRGSLPVNTPTAAPPTKKPSRLGKITGAIGRGVAGGGKNVGGTALMAGASLGAAVGASQIGGGGPGAQMAGMVAGAVAPDLLAAGFAKLGPVIDGAKAKLAGLASTLSGAVASAAKGAGGALATIASGAGSAIAALGRVVAGWGRVAAAAIASGASQARAWVMARLSSIAGAVSSLFQLAAGYARTGAAAVLAGIQQAAFAAKTLVIRGALLAWAAAQWVLNAAMTANPIGIVIAIIVALVAAFIYAWKNSETFRNIVMGVLGAIGDFFKMIWDSVLSPIFGWIGDAIGAVVWAFQNWRAVVSLVLTLIGNIVKGVYNATLKPIFDLIGSYIDTLVWAFRNWRTVVDLALNAIGNIFGVVYRNLIKPIIDAIMGGLDWVKGGFNTAVDFIGRVWNKIRGMLAKPINFMIDWVWNKGLRKAWNLVADLLPGIDPVPPLALIPEFARGGRVPGSGDKDTVPAMLTPGEYVISKPVVKKWGIENIHAAHMRATSGSKFPGLEGMFTGDEKGIYRTGFAAGGPVQAGLDFARKQVGKPYGWGQVGPSSYDCSGFMSAIANVLMDRNPYQRIGSTGSAPWPGWSNGLNSAFGVGYFKGSPGHMAGTLAGNNVESGGNSSNVKMGGGAHGATSAMFTNKMSLPQVGGQFIGGGGDGDDGGWLREKIAAWFREIVDPLINKLPIPPPKFSGISREMATLIRDTAVKWMVGQVPNDPGPGGGDNGTGPVADQVRGVAARYGWADGSEWDALSRIIQKESSWNPGAANPNSSARGLFQKMTSIHGPIENTAAGQAEWGLRYIKDRYGDPINAWAFHQAHGYYGKGGPVGDVPFATGGLVKKPDWLNKANASATKFPLQLGQTAPEIGQLKSWLGISSAPGFENYFSSSLSSVLKAIQGLFGSSSNGLIQQWAWDQLAKNAPPANSGFAEKRAAFNAATVSGGGNSLSGILDILKLFGSVPATTSLKATDWSSVMGVINKVPALANVFGGAQQLQQQVAQVASIPPANWSASPDLKKYMDVVVADTKNQKEFENNLFTLVKWGYDDLAKALQAKGIGGSLAGGSTAAGTASSEVSALVLSRQAVKSQAAAAAVDQALKNASTVLGDDLSTALTVVGQLRKKPGMGIREVSLATQSTDTPLKPEDIYKSMSKPRAVMELGYLTDAESGKFKADMDAYKRGVAFARGGRVGGHGSGDTVPAWLTPGEYVIRKPAARTLGLETLSALNNADRMANGGPVVHAADLFSPLSVASVPRFALGGEVHAGLVASVSSNGSSQDKSVLFGRDSVNIYNPAPARATDSFESTMRKLSWSGVFK